MGTKRIINMNATTDFESDDNIVVDSETAGTRKMAQSVLKEKLREDCLAGIHNLTSATDFATSDTIVVDNATDGPRGMDKDVLLAKTAENALGSIKNLPTSITAFRSGDVIPVDGPDGTAKMSKDDLLKETAQNALAGNVAPAFEVRTSENPYHENDPVVKDGVLYICKTKHYGNWNAYNFKAVPSWDANIRTMFKSEFQGSDDDSLIFRVRSNDLDIGWIQDGANFNHVSRVRTKMFIPINKGDRIVGVPQGKNIVGTYSFYDATKTYVNSVSNLNNFNTGGSKDVVSEVDGFVRLAFYNNIDTSALSNTDYFDGCCAILRSGAADYVDDARLGKLGNLGFTEDVSFGSSLIERGAYDKTDGTKIGHSARVRNISPIKVSKGDDIYSIDATITLQAILFNSTGTIVDTTSDFTQGYKVPFDGTLVFYAYTTGAFSKDAFFDKIKIKRKQEEFVFISDIDYIKKAYYDSNGVIHSHANRLANFREIWANKGDELICNDYDLTCNVLEQSISTGTILASHSWFSSRYIAPGDTTTCKNAVVQNDNVRLLFTFAPAYGSPNVDRETQQHCIKIVRKSFDDYKTLFARRVLPIGSKKGHSLSQFPYTSQSGCFVGDELWVSVDGAGDTHYINVVDVDTDTVQRTISSELGHSGVMDYCEDTDTLISSLDAGASSKLRLIPNASTITASIDLADCIEVDLNFSPGVVCFGENPQIIYASMGFDSLTSTRVNKIRKIWLEMSSGVYTGNATLLKEYDIVIDQATYCDFGPLQQAYTQDSAYDGYLYLAFGTSGHNFLILEKDEERGTFTVIGRYAYDYYTSAGVKKYLEPELLALKGDRIYCGSRHYSEQLASLVWLQR